MNGWLFTNVADLRRHRRARLFPGEVLVARRPHRRGRRGRRTLDRAGADSDRRQRRDADARHGRGACAPDLAVSVERVVNTMKLPLEEHLLVTAQNARITARSRLHQRLFRRLARRAVRARRCAT